jgi:hypothetical protein
MKKYRVSYYFCGSNRLSRKYFDTVSEALRFSVYKIQYPMDFFGIDLVDQTG